MQVEANLGRLPNEALADAGYFSEAALTDPRLGPVELYVPPNRRERSKANAQKSQGTPGGPAAEAMRDKLATSAGKAAYKQRKAIVEPVFGQIKEVRGFRRFSLRGLAAVAAEWDIVCLTHNLLKLFRSGKALLAPCGT